MYETFYNLKEPPFRLTPDPAFMCMTAQHQEALAGLVYNVCTRPGLGVLVGEAGTGKSTLIHALMGMLESRNCVTAVCTNPTLNRQEFYDFLMLKFEVRCESALKSRQVDALEQQLRQNHAEGRRSLLIIDEAQRLPVDLLEEVRLLLNLETTQEKLLQIILAGQPELLETLSRYELRQLKQRVSAISKLRSLNRQELGEYVSHRLDRAGLPQQQLFPPVCLDAIQQYSGGIPRLVNTLCEAALEIAFAGRSPIVTTTMIEEAAADLELTRSPAAAGRLEPQETTATVTAHGTNGHSVAVAAASHGDTRVPLQAYSERQKSLGLFSSLIHHWK